MLKKIFISFMLDSSDGVGRGAKSGWQIAVCVCVSVWLGGAKSFLCAAHKHTHSHTRK